jgi:hypothetical protein
MENQTTPIIYPAAVISDQIGLKTAAIRSMVILT